MEPALLITDLGGLAELGANDLPLVGLVLLDSLQKLFTLVKQLASNHTDVW